MIKNTLEKKEAIQSIVRTAVDAYATGFRARHEGEVDNPNGVINMKIHNVFIAALGKDIQYYSALVRSLDSSLGNMLEGMAINIAKLFYEVNKSVEGELYPEQTSKIAEFLEAYKNSKNPLKPSIEHFKEIRSIKPNPNSKIQSKVHVSDYYLVDKETNTHHLIELKIGGDLDNKKARSEKEAIFEQFAILANSLGKDATIKAHFATAYNRFGEDNEWKQGRVLQFFSKDELLIGKDFWNFVCKSKKGYELVLETYKENMNLIFGKTANHFLKTKKKYKLDFPLLNLSFLYQ